MNTENVNLNLTRKWRSKSFDQIVGQELSVRMLKNSLYLNQFFPVYLFSGQRGCGKTSTARVFASAINCVNLSKFQKNPKKSSMPCLSCASCKAILAGNHPDFIEIDAASHTGVDNVRQIIESSSFMPLMGNKKIYLIDEAHMLSKAAFNAFLKILEEPPSSVLFVLATTNPHKIIETVRSRCFQLFFKPVEQNALIDHLTMVCKEEKISYEEAGLGIIVAESQGSVRDSLNILEQVRFSSGLVTKESVQNILGHINDESILKLFGFLLTCGPQGLLQYLKDIKYETFSPAYLWKKVIDLVRASLWVKHGVLPNGWEPYVEKIDTLVKKTSLARLHYIMQLFYENEGVFIKTTEKHSLFEMILIQITKKNDISNKSGASSAPNKVFLSQDEELPDEEEYEEIEEEIEEDASLGALGVSDNWDRFLVLLKKLEDPLLSSIFSNGQVMKFERTSGDLEVVFSKQFSFFKDSLQETKHVWLPILQDIYTKDITFKPIFTGDAPINKNKINKHQNHQDNQNDNRQEKYPQDYVRFKKENRKSCKSMYNTKNNASKVYNRGEENTAGACNSGKLIDVSDASTWKKANTLLKYFSGIIREIREV